jgi:Flp pilus assembly protein TadD
MVLMVILGWLSMASAAYFFVKYRRDYSEVKFRHMLLYPFEKEAYRSDRGDYLVEVAKNQITERRYRDAFYNLRVGSSLSPKNRDGRLLLSQFYAAWQRPDLAKILLVDGLVYHSSDSEYLDALFNFLLQRQADSELIQLTDKMLNDLSPDAIASGLSNLIGMARATAQFFRGNFDAAEETLRKFKLNNEIDGQILLIRINWERGERDGPLENLANLALQAPDNDRIYAQHTAFLREIGRDDDLRRMVVLRQLSYPDRPRPRIDLLYIYDKAGNETGVNLGVEDVFRDFGKDAEVMLGLGDFAANTGRAALARRIYDHCKANDLPWEGAALMTVEAHVVAKEYKEALAACTQMQEDNPDWGKRFGYVFNGLQAIANFGMADVEAAQLFLNNFLNQSGIRAENLVAVSNRLVTVGAFDQARVVLAQAIKSDPLNQTALTGIIRLDLQRGHADSATTYLRSLLDSRKPPRALLADAYDRLSSDHYLLTPNRLHVLNDIQKVLVAQRVN